MNEVSSVIVLGALLAAVAFGQVEPRSRAGHHTAAPAASLSAGDSASPAPRRLYEHNLNFYEFVLRQLNPNDKDWGGWYEERRAALVDAALHNPCFWYCLGLTLACLCHPSQPCSNPSPTRIASTTSWASGWMRCVGSRPAPTRWPLKPSTSTTPTSSFAIGLLRRKRRGSRQQWPEVRKMLSRKRTRPRHGRRRNFRSATRPAWSPRPATPQPRLRTGRTAPLPPATRGEATGRAKSHLTP